MQRNKGEVKVRCPEACLGVGYQHFYNHLYYGCEAGFVPWTSTGKGDPVVRSVTRLTMSIMSSRLGRILRTKCSSIWGENKSMWYHILDWHKKIVESSTIIFDKKLVDFVWYLCGGVWNGVCRIVSGDGGSRCQCRVSYSVVKNHKL